MGKQWGAQERIAQGAGGETAAGRSSGGCGQGETQMTKGHSKVAGSGALAATVIIMWSFHPTTA